MPVGSRPSRRGAGWLLRALAVALAAAALAAGGVEARDGSAKEMRSLPADRRDHYEVLGVEEDASTADIKKKYREWSRVLHPDKTKNNETLANKFTRIAEAYAVLVDPYKREQYDDISWMLDSDNIDEF